MEHKEYDKEVPLDPKIEGIDVSSCQHNEAGLLILPDDVAKLAVLQICHDSGIAGSWGRHRTYELVARHLWWPDTNGGSGTWREDVAAYVAGCNRCQLARADRHSKTKRLVPMLTGIQPLEGIAMDFVEELPQSKGFNAILVVTDRFMKIQQYIPA